MARFSHNAEAFAVLARRLQVTQEQLTIALQNAAITFADTEALCLRLPAIAIDFGRSEMLNLDAIEQAEIAQRSYTRIV